MDTQSIISFSASLGLIATVIIANWKKPSFCNIRRYTVALVFGVLTLLVCTVATIFDIQPFIGLDVIPWETWATFIALAVFTMATMVSWKLIHDKIADEGERRAECRKK